MGDDHDAKAQQSDASDFVPPSTFPFLPFSLSISCSPTRPPHALVFSRPNRLLTYVRRNRKRRHDDNDNDPSIDEAGAARVGEGGGHGGRGEGEVDEAECFHRQPQGLHHADTGTGRRTLEGEKHGHATRKLSRREVVAIWGGSGRLGDGRGGTQMGLVVAAAKGGGGG